MQRLYKASCSDDNHAHRKFLRQIMVSMDILAPRYWWTEFDTYKVGTVSNSCSTMHKIHAKEFTLDDFSHEHLIGDFEPIPRQDAKDAWKFFIDPSACPLPIKSDTLLLLTREALNFYRKRFIETNDRLYWWQLIQLLPQSYNQLRTVTFNYEVAVAMIKQRTNHRLDEWNEFVQILRDLPYLSLIMGESPNS